jgi:DNA-binding NarL/FixJ family response regulator
MKKIKLLIADDDWRIRSDLFSYFSKHENIEIAGEAVNGFEAIDKCRKLLPDIILMDISMPVLNGLKVAKVIRNELPMIKILVFTVHDEIEYANEFRKLGVNGYILKGCRPEELLSKIVLIDKGESYFMVR